MKKFLSQRLVSYFHTEFLFAECVVQSLLFRQKSVIKISKPSPTKNEQLANMVSKGVTSKIGVDFLGLFEWATNPSHSNANSRGVTPLVSSSCFVQALQILLGHFSDTCQGVGHRSALLWTEEMLSCLPFFLETNSIKLRNSESPLSLPGSISASSEIYPSADKYIKTGTEVQQHH